MSEPTTNAASDHDDRCESEFISGPMAWSPCGCEHRAAHRRCAERCSDDCPAPVWDDKEFTEPTDEHWGEP